MPEEPPDIGPLNADLINDTAIPLTWQSSSTEICKNNFVIVNRCVQIPDIILTVTPGFAYQYRVKATLDCIPGKWSDPVCIIFSVSPQLILKQ